MRRTMRAFAVVVTGAAALAVGIQVSSAANQVAERILIMGSSTTGCAGPSTTARCYVNLVKAAHPQDAFTVLARGGTYIGYGTPAQNWTQTTIPSGHDRVVIQLGINDWYVPVAPSTFRQQIDNLVIRVKTANPGTKIVWLRTWMPTPGDTSDGRKAMWTLHGNVAADAMFYARQSNAVGGPAEATFIDMGTTPSPRRSNMAADNGWHYNDRGHAEMAAAVNDWIARY
jgi:lysophospholipase L1-like esterase